MIDEASRRKPGFSEGVPVELGDGQTWTFPELTLRVRLTPRRESEPGPHAFNLVRAAGAELPRYPRWIQTITSPTPVPGPVWWDAHFDAAKTLLLLNYDLSDDELDGLLWWEQDDEASDRRWEAIGLAIQGIGAPKPPSAT